MNNKSINLKNSCNFYIFLYLLYNRGVFFPSYIYQPLLLIVLLVSIYYFFYVNNHYKSQYIIAVNILIALFTIYGVIFIVNGEIIYFEGVRLENYRYIVNIYSYLLPIYPLYAFSRKGYLNDHSIRQWILIFLGVVVATYFLNEIRIKQSSIGDVDELTNNIGYSFLSLMPLLFFIKKPIVQYLLLLVILLFVFLSMKRGAIIISIAGLLFFLYRNRTSFSNKPSTIYILMLSAFVIASLYNYVIYQYNTSIFFQYRVEKTLAGSTSGRDYIYEKAINYLSQENGLSLIVGNGANQTYAILGNRAHNDWLELLINQGLIGFIVYLFYWMTIAFYLKKARKQGLLFNVLSMFGLIYFTKSFFSMSYDSLDIYAIIAVCWSIANIDKARPHRFVK